ncbi:uncharacterized protein CTRU02_210410 [Colletotrichum truncatum]|uniref:Uncharacterized protein n=1 Tax=Colletotrichum truncatum TaxID=5467 RepID=A0ACC3YP12_COLTU
MFPRTLLNALILGLSATALADKHRLCACESGRGDGVDDTRTQKVVNAQNGRFVFSNKYWDKSDGAPHPGHYAFAISGRIVNKRTKQIATDDGYIGGDEMNGLCPEHSTCFTPKRGSYTDCGITGDGGCSSAWGSVDSTGQVV